MRIAAPAQVGAAVAKAADRALAEGVHSGPLHGVPFTVKDSFDTTGVLTQHGSPIFKGRIPDTDATSVARIKEAGGFLLAKTNLPEFSYSTESDTCSPGGRTIPTTSIARSAARAVASRRPSPPDCPLSGSAVTWRSRYAARPPHRHRRAEGRLRPGPHDRRVAARIAAGLACEPHGPHRPRHRPDLLTDVRTRRRRRLHHHPPLLRRRSGRRPRPPGARGLARRLRARPHRPQVAATVQAAAEAVNSAGVQVEQVDAPAQLFRGISGPDCRSPTDCCGTAGPAWRRSTDASPAGRRARRG